MTTRLIDPDWLPDLRKPRIAHKYSHGHALILSGGPGKGGAARLAARAALRIGAGALTLLCPPAALAENAARLDAIMLDTCAHAAALRDQLADRRVRAVLLGPALGLARDQADLVGAALAGSPECGVVLDADAITHLARDPILKSALHTGCVLTPHAGEFARLCPDIAARLDASAQVGPAYSKLDATRDAARALGCTVAFKGPIPSLPPPTGRLRCMPPATTARHPGWPQRGLAMCWRGWCADCSRAVIHRLTRPAGGHGCMRTAPWPSGRD